MQKDFNVEARQTNYINSMGQPQNIVDHTLMQKANIIMENSSQASIKVV